MQVFLRLYFFSFILQKLALQKLSLKAPVGMNACKYLALRVIQLGIFDFFVKMARKFIAIFKFE